MKSKKGPLGTPLGNPLKHWNDQKELAKADRGRIIPKSMIPHPSEVKIPIPYKRASDLSMNPTTDLPKTLDTLPNPYSRGKSVVPLKVLEEIEKFKNRPMKKGGSVKRKRK